MLPLLNTQATPSSPGSGGKVELDLEGAPFLEPDPPEQEEQQAQAEAAVPAAKQGTQQEELPKKSRKKLALILAGAGALILIGVLAAAYFFFLKTPPPLEPEIEVVVVPSTPPELPMAPVSMFNISWPPFWVEVQDPEGEIRFVYCKFMLITDNQRVALQVTNKNTILRDAVYYYLRHKPYAFLADLKQLDVLKSEVLNIINYYILPEQSYERTPEGTEPAPVDPTAPVKFEKVSEVLIEEYLIK